MSEYADATSGEADEQPLRGGLGARAVVRVGNTVRRPLGAHSDFVHRVLLLLERAGFEGAPRFLGIDRDGREVLTFVEGTTLGSWEDVRAARWTDDQMERVARLLREMHDVASRSELAGPHETIVHNDVSPLNTVFRNGVPVAFIDFDAAHPGSRYDDLGQAFWLFASLGVHSSPVAEQCRRLRLMCEAYGEVDAERLIAAFEAEGERHRRRHEELRHSAPTEAEREASRCFLREFEASRPWWVANRDRFAAAADRHVAVSPLSRSRHEVARSAAVGTQSGTQRKGADT